MTDTRATLEPSPCLVIVAGPGRSGTSLVTGLMGCLGFYVPQPEIRANATNPKGFGEPKWALDYHKRVMRSAGVDHGDTRPEAIDLVSEATTQAVRRELVAWLRDQFVASDRVVIKDPRLVWFADAYRAAAEELGVGFGVLTMLRHPAETIRSAILAYGTLPVSTRTAGWINGALAIERTTRSMPRVFVKYEDLMDDWRKTLDAAGDTLAIDLTGLATKAQLDHAAQLPDASLRRSHPGWADLGVPLALQARAMRTYDALVSLADAHIAPGDDRGTGQHELDQLTRIYTAEYNTALDVVWSSTTAAVAAARRRGGLADTPAAPDPAPGPPILTRALSRARRAAERRK